MGLPKPCSNVARLFRLPQRQCSCYNADPTSGSGTRVFGHGRLLVANVPVESEVYVLKGIIQGSNRDSALWGSRNNELSSAQVQ